jgi:large subunit ribosomal protein L3
MPKASQPRRGSMAFYPRVRAKKQTPSIKAYSTEPKALSFMAYKVGMTQVLGKNIHKGNPTFGQDVVIPVTVIAVPSMKIFGVRAYAKEDIGVQPLSDVLADNVDSVLKRKLLNFKTPSQKKAQKAEKKGGKKINDEKRTYTIEDFEKEVADIQFFTLLAHTQPGKLGFKKTPDISEVYIGGTKEEQLAYAKEKLGKEVAIEDVIKEGEFLDVRAVTKGKGIQGVIKRFNVRMLRPKAKKRRIVGCISPWTPHTVMYTVARPGQMGYQNRTEVNKKVLKISDDLEAVNPITGFPNYGMVKEKYAVIQGSLPGPTKRCISLRKSTRPERKKGKNIQVVEKILVN